MTNPTIESVVGKYYKFARTASAAPEAYPFGDPLAVNTFPTITDTTPPENVIKAIYDAQEYGLTLFLTFRQIQSSPGSPGGYPLAILSKSCNIFHKIKSVWELLANSMDRME